MKDLEGRGIPSVMVATTEFQDGAEHQAASLGVDPAVVYVAHPIQDRSDEELVALADAAVEELVSKLTRSGSA